MCANRLILALGFLLVLDCVSGCNLRPEEEMIDVRGVVYTLRPLSESKPVDLSSVKFKGYCSETTKEELAQFLGRIPGPVSVVEIEVVWSEKPLAARIKLGRGRFHILGERAGQNLAPEGGSQDRAKRQQPNQQIESMTRSAVTFILNSGTVGALLVMAHPHRSAERDAA